MDKLPTPNFGFANGCTIENLKSLRRKLCSCFPPASDNRCDCKFIIDGKIDLCGGEHTGCCEIRQAIQELMNLREQVKVPEVAEIIKLKEDLATANAKLDAVYKAIARCHS